MKKASYEEFLPPEFDSKTELKETLKSYTTSRVENKTSNENLQQQRATLMSSRQTIMSFFDDNNQILRSETDLNTSQMDTKDKTLRNCSRLSGEPVLSPQQLTENLNKNDQLISSNQNEDDLIHKLTSDSLMNYENEYCLIESENNRLHEEMSKLENKLLVKKLTNDETISQNLTESSKKITKETELVEKKPLLIKRGQSQEKRLLNSALIVKIPAFQQQKSEFDDNSLQLVKTKINKKVMIKKRNERLCRIPISDKTELVNKNLPVMVDLNTCNDNKKFNEGRSMLDYEKEQESLNQLSEKNESRSIKLNNTRCESKLSIIDRETFHSAGLFKYLKKGY